MTLLASSPIKGERLIEQPISDDSSELGITFNETALTTAIATTAGQSASSKTAEDIEIDQFSVPLQENESKEEGISLPSRLTMWHYDDVTLPTPQSLSAPPSPHSKINQQKISEEKKIEISLNETVPIESTEEAGNTVLLGITSSSEEKELTSHASDFNITIDNQPDESDSNGREISLSWQTQVANAQLYGEGDVEDVDEEESDTIQNEIIQEAAGEERRVEIEQKTAHDSITISIPLPSEIKEEKELEETTPSKPSDIEIEAKYNEDSSKNEDVNIILSAALSSVSLASSPDTDIDREAIPPSSLQQESFKVTKAVDSSGESPLLTTKAFTVELATATSDLQLTVEDGYDKERLRQSEETKEEKEKEVFNSSDHHTNPSENPPQLDNPESTKGKEEFKEEYKDFRVQQAPRQRKQWEIRPPSTQPKSLPQFSFSAPIHQVLVPSPVKNSEFSPTVEPSSFKLDIDKTLLSSMAILGPVFPSIRRFSPFSTSSSAPSFSSSFNFESSQASLKVEQLPSSPLISPQPPISPPSVLHFPIDTACFGFPFTNSNRVLCKAVRQTQRDHERKMQSRSKNAVNPVEKKNEEKMENEAENESERRELSWDELRVMQEIARRKETVEIGKASKTRGRRTKAKVRAETLTIETKPQEEAQETTQPHSAAVNQYDDFRKEEKSHQQKGENPRRREKQSLDRSTKHRNQEKTFSARSAAHRSSSDSMAGALGKRWIGADLHPRDGESVLKRHRNKYRLDKSPVWVLRRNEEQEEKVRKERKRQMEEEERIRKEVEKRETLAKVPLSHLFASAKPPAPPLLDFMRRSSSFNPHHHLRHSINASSITHHSRALQRKQKLETEKQTLEFITGLGVVFPPFENPFQKSASSSLSPFSFTANQTQQPTDDLISTLSFNNSNNFSLSLSPFSSLKASVRAHSFGDRGRSHHISPSPIQIKAKKNLTFPQSYATQIRKDFGVEKPFEESKESLLLPSTSTFIPYNGSFPSTKMSRPSTAASFSLSTDPFQSLSTNTNSLKSFTHSPINDPYKAAPTSPGKKMKATITEGRGRKRHEETEEKNNLQKPRPIYLVTPRRPYTAQAAEGDRERLNVPASPIERLLDSRTFNQPRRAVLNPLVKQSSSAYAEMGLPNRVKSPFSRSEGYPFSAISPSFVPDYHSRFAHPQHSKNHTRNRSGKSVDREEFTVA